ncbi:MAG: hypothetical protein Q9173_000222 [Seirophora scorigena]
MSQAQAPRVKLPNVTPPKFSLPNTNSWTVGQVPSRIKPPTATHRDKYENKPMPPTPEASPSPAEKPLTARKNRGYIQPAIPLTSPSPANPTLKNRAVTDPVVPKPLFTSTTTTVNQLRKKNQNTSRSHYSGEILQPTIYTPNNYAGVWENNPNIGHTLPPFSTFPQPPLSEAGQRVTSQTSGDVPIILQRFPGESSHGSGFTQSLQSHKFWAPSDIGNSFAQPDPPSSGAVTTPRFSTHTRTNSVPPPPLSYPGFQPSGPMPPCLVQMELGLHHHIETCFGSLMRLNTDHADRTVDKMVRRIEDLQETVEKGFKGLRSEVRDVRKEMISMRKELAERPGTSASLKDSISSLDEKLSHLDQKFDAIGSRYQRAAAEMSESEREATSSVYSQSKESPLRRSESVHTSASSGPEPPQPYLSGAAHSSSSSAHHSWTRYQI